MSYFKGKLVLVTAGPTHEKIDDVRFVGNYSTGKMGFALAEAAYELGAVVTLVTGPTFMKCNSAIDRIDVESAEQMYRIVTKFAPNQDTILMSAAVADYTPVHKFDGKLKKDKDTMTIEMVRTKDILKALGETKPKKQILLGFALETDNLIENAKEKLVRKNCNIIVANLANTNLSGFGSDVNTITILDDRNNMIEVPTANKLDIARTILKQVSLYVAQQESHS